MSFVASYTLGRSGRISGATFLWTVIATVLVVANVVVIASAFTTVRLWEDEAFNLTVPLNLLRGLGYTSDGTLSGSELTPFDVRISTGPTMLLPVAGLIGAGLDPVVAGRLVGLAGYLLLIVSLALLGARLGGRWAGLAAAALPLAYAADVGLSPIQTPIDLLGEVSAAGLLVAALLVLHRRPWLAGLLVGLAMQTKFIAALALPAFAIAALLDQPGSSILQRARGALPRVLAAAACAAAPTVVFELVKLASLGWAGYLQNLRNFAGFLLGGGQHGFAVPPIEKLGAMFSAWHLPWWLVTIVIAIALALAVTGARVVLREPRSLGVVGHARVSLREFAVVIGVAFLGLASYLAWWLLSSHTPTWLRHPAPAVLAFAPVLAAAAITLGRIALRGAERAPAERARKAVAGTLAVAGIALLVASVWGRTLQPGYPTGETLTDQRAAASRVAELGSEWFASPWGSEVVIVVLSGAHSGLVDAGDAVRGDLQLWHAARLPESCDPLLEAGRYRVCAAPSP